MKTKSPCASALVAILSVIITIPADMYADPQAGTQRAGEIARLIPAANIERGAKTITAAPKSVVDWHDLVNTQVNGRARVALDDGSVLNVGSESSMKVEKHDAGAQQTELELTYGKMRSQAMKLSRPDGKFEVHTAAGVAGVVGTDFYVGYDNNMMIVIAFEGIVRVCDLAGHCVLLKAGQMTSVRNGDNSGPLAPAQATLETLTTAVADTNVGGAGGLQHVEQTATHLSKGTIITLGLLAAIPAVVIPIVVSRSAGKTTAPPPTQTQGCQPGVLTAAC
jgi:FecR protein